MSESTAGIAGLVTFRYSLDPLARGIDLAKKANDIRRIVLKHFRVPGVHPDDLVQEVYLAILRGNALPSAFDPARSSFSHYVYIVARSTAIALVGRESRQWRIKALATEATMLAQEKRRAT